MTGYGDDTVKAALKRMLEANLHAARGESILVFADRISPQEIIDDITKSRREGLLNLCRLTAETAREMGLGVRETVFEALGSHGSEPADELWRLGFGERACDALAGTGVLGRIIRKVATPEDIERARETVRINKAGAVDMVAAFSNYSTSHTRFRDLLTTEAGARYASMPLFETDMLFGPMDVDIKAVEKRTLKAVEALDGAVSAKITTPEGTDITLGLEGRKAHPDTGVLDSPGSFSNLPAGEAYIAPVEGTANGRLVILWGPSGRLGSPVEVTVREGRVTDVAGSGPFKKRLLEELDKNRDNRNIAELGIGTNDKAKRPDNILESEKILGTVHIAFGDNSSMGGRVSTPYHQDFVYFGPTVTLAGKEGGVSVLLDSGELLV